jgi:Histidinol dehydrogenase
MIAGPSEVLIIADENANPVYAAADLLSQAEHDELAMPILVTTSAELGEQVIEEVYRQISKDLSRKEIAKKSVDDYGFVFIVKDLDEAFELSNQIAPEHLELLIKDPMASLEKVKNAGAIFMGAYTPEPLGDYFAGPTTPCRLPAQPNSPHLWESMTISKNPAFSPMIRPHCKQSIQRLPPLPVVKDWMPMPKQLKGGLKTNEITDTKKHPAINCLQGRCPAV